MLEEVCKNTEIFIEQMPKSLRKEYGQFFTSQKTAQYMASLFTIPSEKKDIYALDAGAGSGILSVALIERFSQVLSADQSLHLFCYENDKKVLPLLEKNLNIAKEKSNIQLKITIIEDNYILSQKDLFEHSLFGMEDHLQYDVIIGNPPYKKIAKDALEALAIPDVCYGAPNLYFLFAAMGIKNLKENAELVYIIPRSWTSGAYFEKFRDYLFKNTSLTHIHLFESRDKVFDKESVLQETMIIKVKKSKQQEENITISTSSTSNDFANIKILEVPFSLVVSSPHHYVHLVTDEAEVKALKEIKKFKKTLPELGLKMKTGLVVDFRSRELLRNQEEVGTVPLIYSQHIKRGRVRFPQGKDNEYILQDRKGLIQENRNYLFVKRFTAKEEPRRLQCGIYLKKYLPSYAFISSQNKVNFIDGLKGLSECVVYGLYVIFNSSLYDIYYRILNGSTQVNSTEVNSLPVPSMSIIEEMGKQLIAAKNLSVEQCNKILNHYVKE